MSEVELPGHLKDVDPEKFKIRRIKKGKGFCFVDEQNNLIKAHEKVQELKQIGVPNTWSEVRISSNPSAYILAKGYDGSQKLQYLYHPDFLEYRNRRKFSNLYEFGLSLPRIRRRLRRDLAREEWSERKLMALIVRILDKYHLRIGSRLYARQNQTFGLTTLRKKHLKEIEAAYSFRYTGKSGQKREVPLHDPRLVQLIEELADLPGWELFSFKKGGDEITATATKVNDYIRNISGGDFSARTFRTWAGTVLAVRYHNAAKKEAEQNPRRKLKAVLVELVAQKLGNTSAICESYYIHPKVLEEVSSPDFDSDPCEEQFLKNTLYRKHECRTLEILSRD